MTRDIHVVVDLPDRESLRVDIYLVMQGYAYSRSALKRTCVLIEIEGKKSKLSSLVRHGNSLVITFEHNEISSTISSQDIDIDILDQDNDVLFVNKPSGMVVHPGIGNLEGTLAHACLRYIDTSLWEGFSETNRLGIVHRLDGETSGVIAVAKHRDSYSWITRQFAEHMVDKEYRAVVKGFVQKELFDIESYIQRDRHHRTRFVVDKSKGRYAYTRVRVLQRFRIDDGNFSYVALFPKTGRTHQLRVHMQSLGHPILGDKKYARKDSRLPDALMHLHAYNLSFLRCDSTEKYRVQAPLPSHMLKTLECCGEA